MLEDTEDLFNKAIQFHQKRAFEDAKRCYQQLLSVDSQHTAAAINLGAVYRQLGLMDEAIACYQTVLKHTPNSLEAWFNLANLYSAQKRWQEAQKGYQQVLLLQPKHTQSLYQLASIARAQEQWQSGCDYLQQLLDIEPKHASALLDQGNAWQHLGQRQQALICYQRLVEHHPNSWKGHYSLARWYDAEPNPRLFEQHLTLTLRLAPSAWQVYHNLAVARFDLGNYAGAKVMYLRALEIDASNLSSLIGLGAAYSHLGDHQRALGCFQKASQSDDIHTLSELARVVWEYKYFDFAVASLKKIVNLRPDIEDAHFNLAKAYTETWQMALAIEALQATLKINPNHQEAQDLLANIYIKQGRGDQSLPIFLAKIEREGPLSRSISSYLFNYLYRDTVAAEEKAEAHKQMMQPWVDQLVQPTQFLQSKDPDRTIKIGFVSADYRDQHPVGIFIEPLFRHYDHKRWEVSAYYNSRTYDTSTSELKALVDHWTDVANWTDERLKARILEDQIDILVDLSGHTSKHRLMLFAMRAAPLQVTWMGYPHSTGLATMDYLIADPIVCPPENDGLCSEQVVRLPNHCVFCLPPKDQFGPVDPVRPAQRQQIVFGSFNNLAKVNPATLSLWVDVLQAVPDALLKLKTPSFTDPHCIDDVERYFVDAGVDQNRLIFTGPSALDAMMREYAEVDIALDTIPYNGGTTTFQALWMGVPVITLAGENFCGRMGMSIMHHLAMTDWIAQNRAEFVEIAVKKARHKTELLAVKQQLRERMLASPLCDTVGFAESMYHQLAHLWTQYCAQGSERDHV